MKDHAYKATRIYLVTVLYTVIALWVFVAIKKESPKRNKLVVSQKQRRQTQKRLLLKI